MKKLVIIVYIIINIFALANTINDDIEISDMKLSEVVAILSKISGRNIIAENQYKDMLINAYFSAGTSVDEILRSIAKSNGLIVEQSNNVTMLNSKTQSSNGKIVGRVLDYHTKTPIKGATIEVKGAKIKTVTDTFGTYIIDSIPKEVYIIKISSDGYQNKAEIISVDKRINNSVVYLNSDQLDKNTNDAVIENDFLIMEDGMFYTKSFNLLNGKYEDLKKILKELYGENIKISGSEENNQLIILGDKDIILSASKVIQNFDVRPKQVRIESEILDVSNNLFEELGFDWAFGTNRRKQNNDFQLDILNGVKSIVSGSLFGSGLNIVRQFADGASLLSFSISMLEANNDIIISSVPTITIESGKSGEFKVSEEVVIGERKSRQKDDDSTYNVVEPIFKEAGLIMKVKPIVTDNDEMILDISLELSDFKFKQNLSDNSVNSGTFNSSGGSKIGRSINTRVRVKNGETILIGGLKKSSKNNSVSKVPVVSEIPIVGNLFKKTSKKFETSDMYIKITATIEDSI